MFRKLKEIAIAIDENILKLYSRLCEWTRYNFGVTQYSLARSCLFISILANIIGIYDHFIPILVKHYDSTGIFMSLIILTIMPLLLEPLNDEEERNQHSNTIIQEPFLARLRTDSFIRIWRIMVLPVILFTIGEILTYIYQGHLLDALVQCELPCTFSFLYIICVHLPPSNTRRVWFSKKITILNVTNSAINVRT